MTPIRERAILANKNSVSGIKGKKKLELIANIRHYTHSSYESQL